MIKKIIQNIIFDVFVRTGTWLFSHVVIYAPGDGENVEVVHFGISEQAIAKSCHEFSENSIK